MDFIIDAQLPFSLVALLNEQGHSALHTSQLPQKNFTPDSVIIKISIQQKRVVITKDSDFYHSFVVKREPYKLLLVRAGNMRNKELKNLISSNLPKIITSLSQGDLVELTMRKINVLY